MRRLAFLVLFMGMTLSYQNCGSDLETQAVEEDGTYTAQLYCPPGERCPPRLGPIVAAQTWDSKWAGEAIPDSMGVQQTLLNVEVTAVNKGSAPWTASNLGLEVVTTGVNQRTDSYNTPVYDSQGIAHFYIRVVSGATTGDMILSLQLYRRTDGQRFGPVLTQTVKVE